MKILVTCFSQTGNTRKVAETFFATAAAKGHQVDLHDLSKITPQDLNEYDLVFVGSTCHSADIAKPVADFLEGFTGQPKFQLVGFVTHSTRMAEGSEINRKMYERWAGKCEGTFERLGLEKGCKFLGYFHCQGAPSEPIANFIHQEIIPDKVKFDEYLKEVQGHPNQQDLQAAKDFARMIIAAI